MDTSNLSLEELELRSFCGNPHCPCAHDDAVACEEFQSIGRTFFSHGRCARCGCPEEEHEN